MDTRHVVDRIENDWEYGHREERKSADEPWVRSLHSDYLKNLQQFWFQKVPIRIMREDIGIETTVERANEFTQAIDSNPDLWYYLALASGKTDEALKWIMGTLAGEANARGLRFSDITKLISAEHLNWFATAIEEGRIDRTFTKAIMAEMLTFSGDREAFDALLAEPRFKAVSADDLEPVIDKIIADNPDQFEKAKANPKLIQWFVGQTMKATQGKAPAPKVIEIMTRKLA